MVMQQSRYKFVAIIVCHKNDRDWMNTKAEAKLGRPAGSDMFSSPLYRISDGVLAGYWSSIPLRRDQLDLLVGMLDAKPRTWSWVWVRPRMRGNLQHLKDQYDYQKYRDTYWL
jgi:hypothetical protein